MDSDPQRRETAGILAVVVLYKQRPYESRSLSGFIKLLERNKALAARFSLLIYDNSPQSDTDEVRASCPVRYWHDPSNGGLATAYNYALNLARSEHLEWLLLLDQDTSLTLEFLRELVECSEAVRGDEKIAAITPKLIIKGQVYSPAAHFVDQLRRQYLRSTHAVPVKAVGVQNGRLGAYNSGTTLRVSALEQVGGFPGEYWLDYLDHAVFHTLWAHGYQVFVMRSQIAHEVSQAAIEAVPAWRQRNLLIAQARFVHSTGSFFDRSILYRIWLLRHALMLWRRHPDRQLWKEILCEAFTLTFHLRQAGKSPPSDGR